MLLRIINAAMNTLEDISLQVGEHFSEVDT